MMAFVLPSHHYVRWGSALLEAAEHLGRRVFICLCVQLLLPCAAFAFPHKLSLSHPLSFPAFILLILSPIPLVRSDKQLCGVCLPAEAQP